MVRVTSKRDSLPKNAHPLLTLRLFQVFILFHRGNKTTYKFGHNMRVSTLYDEIIFIFG